MNIKIGADIARALKIAGIDKLPAVAKSYLGQRLARGGIDIDRNNMGALRDLRFGAGGTQKANFPAIGDAARALVSISYRAAPRAWGDVSDHELAGLNTYPIRNVAIGSVMDPDEALRRWHRLTPVQALNNGWQRVQAIGSSTLGWAAPGTDAFGPTGPSDTLPVPIIDGGIAYMSIDDAIRAGARRKDDGSFDLSAVKPVARVHMFASDGVRLGAWRDLAYFAGGIAALLVFTGVTTAAFRAGAKTTETDTPAVPPDDTDIPEGDGATQNTMPGVPPPPPKDWPCILYTGPNSPPSNESPTGTWRRMGGKWVPGPGYTCIDGKWRYSPVTEVRVTYAQWAAASNECAKIVCGPVPNCHWNRNASLVAQWRKCMQDRGMPPDPPSGSPAPHPDYSETPAQSQHKAADVKQVGLDQAYEALDALRNYSGVGEAPPILPELDMTFRGLSADWEGFDRIGVGSKVLGALAPDVLVWRQFRDAWKAGSLAAAEIVPRLQAETARASRVRQALREAAIVDPSLQLAPAAASATSWIESLPWLAWALQPGTGPAGIFRAPLIIGGIVVGLMVLSALIKGRRGTKIYMLPPAKTG